MSHFAQRNARPIGTLMALLLPAAALAAGLPPGFVYLRDVAPGIAQDMRYAGANNFTGRPLPGYEAAECVLKSEVAEALAKVQADLAAQNLGLKVYDCYRPTRAVAAFAHWAQTPDDGATKRFYPKLDKRQLFAGYIATHSAHSTGIAVDLTLIPLQSSPVRSRASGNPEPHIRTSQAAPGSPLSASALRASAYLSPNPSKPLGEDGARGRTAKEDDAPCTGPAAARAPDNSLDMGTGFDCFDDKAHTASGAITPDQARRRALLVAAMRKRGFRNYFREWWHFSFGPRPAPAFDFPIAPRPQ